MPHEKVYQEASTVEVICKIKGRKIIRNRKFRKFSFESNPG